MVLANGVRARAALGRYCGLVWSAADGVSCRKSPAKHAGVSDLLTLSFIESRAFVVCWRVHHVMRYRTMFFFLLSFPTQFACAAKLVFGFVMQCFLS